MIRLTFAALAFALALSPALAQETEKVSVSTCISNFGGPRAGDYAAYIAKEHGKGAVSQLVKCLTTHESKDYRKWAAVSLGLMKEDAENAAGALVQEALKGNAAAADAVGKVGVACLPPLMKQLRARSSTHRLLAIKMIANFGPNAYPATSSLAYVVARDKDTECRILAATTLGTIGPKAAGSASALCKAMEEDDTKLLDAAGAALIKFGKHGAKAVGKLVKHKDPKVKIRGIGILSRIPDSGKTGASGLKSGLKDKDPKVRAAAAMALQGYGKSASTCISDLIKLLEDKEPEVAEAARGTLQRLQSDDDLSSSDKKKISKALQNS